MFAPGRTLLLPACPSPAARLPAPDDVSDVPVGDCKPAPTWRFSSARRAAASASWAALPCSPASPGASSFCLPFCFMWWWGVGQALRWAGQQQQDGAASHARTTRQHTVAHPQHGGGRKQRDATQAASNEGGAQRGLLGGLGCLGGRRSSLLGVDCGCLHRAAAAAAAAAGS